MVKLFVRLTPRASRSGIDGWGEDAQGRKYLKVRVNAPPVEGKANAALINCLSDRLNVARSRICLISGETARLKMIEIDGFTEDDLCQSLSK